jgi:hypothetical protein
LPAQARNSVLAMQRGELDAVCGLISAPIPARFGKDLSSGVAKIIAEGMSANAAVIEARAGSAKERTPQ